MKNIYTRSGMGIPHILILVIIFAGLFRSRIFLIYTLNVMLISAAVSGKSNLMMDDRRGTDEQLKDDGFAGGGGGGFLVFTLNL